MLNTRKSYSITKKVELSSYPCCCIYDTRSFVYEKYCLSNNKYHFDLKFLSVLKLIVKINTISLKLLEADK